MTERRFVLVAACIGLLGACGFDLRFDQTDAPSVLDRCSTPGTCIVTGSARQTRGITDDTIGYAIGPGRGSVEVQVPSRSDGGTTTTTSTTGEILVRGTGTYYVNGAAAPAPHDFSWVPITANPTVTVEIRDDASTLEIADATAVSGGCAVSNVRRR